MILKDIRNFFIKNKALFKRFNVLTIPYFLLMFLISLIVIKVLDMVSTPLNCLCIAILISLTCSCRMKGHIVMIHLGEAVFMSVGMWGTLLVIFLVLGFPIIGNIAAFIGSGCMSVEATADFNEQKWSRRQKKFLM